MKNQFLEPMEIGQARHLLCCEAVAARGQTCASHPPHQAQLEKSGLQ